MNNNHMPNPRSTRDLRRILEQFWGLLSLENRSLIAEVIRQVEGGADKEKMKMLLTRVQDRTRVQQSQTEHREAPHRPLRQHQPRR